jgi:hypothetical protein
MRMKLKAKLGLIVLFALCFVAGALMNYVVPFKKNDSVSYSIRTIEFVVKEDAQEKLIGQIKEFAHVNSFSMKIDHLSRDDSRAIQIELRRNDIIIDVTNIIGANKYLIDFFRNFYDKNIPPPSERTVDMLTNELKNYVPELNETAR